jgi:hypothetical protein
MNGSTPKVFGKSINDPVAEELVQSYCNGSASPEQIAELDKLLQRRDDVCDYLIAHSFLVSELISLSSSYDDDARHVEQSPPKAWQATKGMHLLAIAACIGALLCGATALVLSFSRQPEVLGVLRHISSSSASEQLDLIAFLNKPTELNLGDGQYEVSLRNGVNLTVAGPAELAIESLMACRLNRGRITAIVPPAAEGFRILTERVKIVDHGTRFGVAITPDGGTDIAVFEGEVEVHSGDEHRNLRMGRAVSVARDGVMSRMSLVKPDSFEIAKKMLSSLGPAIVSVHDNIRSPSEMKYYRIVHEGFGEDQPAYGDRVHQWNGIDERGLPEELIGADYVMTFNNDRVTKDIVISVALALPSDVYVLLDERIDSPEWLLAEYTDTGLKVGMDEGERPGRPEDPRTLGVGVGNSIDYHFHVWKRNSPSEGTIEFGGLPQMADGYQSMYGILAVPHSKASLAPKNPI